MRCCGIARPGPDGPGGSDKTAFEANGIEFPAAEGGRTCVVSRSRLPSSTGPVESRANLPGPSGKPKYICLTDSVLVP